MVVGQLPFVTTREENVSSQQRRRKLLEQINKGLSNVQKKALTIFTQEFRTMMSKLLTADITKRMTVKQLIFHPWITEKGKKAIRSNPMKKLDERLLKTVGKIARDANQNRINIHDSFRYTKRSEYCCRSTKRT